MKGLGADDAYWHALEQGVLKLQRCEGCDTWHWPAVWRCGACGGWEHGWHEIAPRGRIFAWTRTWHDFGAPAGLTPPFVSVVVELDQLPGKRLVGTLEDAGEDIRIGLPVIATPRHDSFEGEALLAWRWRPLTGPEAA